MGRITEAVGGAPLSLGRGLGRHLRAPEMVLCSRLGRHRREGMLKSLDFILRATGNYLRILSRKANMIRFVF